MGFKEVSILGRKRFSDACYMELNKGIVCGMQVVSSKSHVQGGHGYTRIFLFDIYLFCFLA